MDYSFVKKEFIDPTLIDEISSKISKNQEFPINLEFSSGWDNPESTMKSNYYKDSLGIVHLYICAQTSNGNNQIATLPLGYRPSTTLILPALDWTSNTYTDRKIATIMIQADGRIQTGGLSINSKIAISANFIV